MTPADLANYDTVKRQPITVNYRGFQFASMSPPSSGGLSVGQMLLELERFPVGRFRAGLRLRCHEMTMHAMIEAMRLTFADRAVWIRATRTSSTYRRRAYSIRTYVASRSAMIKLDSRMPTPAVGKPAAFDSVAGLDATVRLAAIPFEEEKRRAHDALLGGR